MKFKIITPLFFLSLVSSAALAASATTTNSSNNNAGFLNQQFQNMNNSPAVDNSVTWFNNIGISGLLNVDGWAQNNSGYMEQASSATDLYQPVKGSQSAISVEAAVLNTQVQVNSWVGADVNLFYADGSQDNNNTTNIDIDSSFQQAMGIWGNRPTRYIDQSESGLIVDQAYIDVGNFAQAPFMLRAGRQYLPFGHYDRYAISPTLTQQLSELRETAVQLAFANQAGFHGAIYGFKGTQKVSVDDEGILSADPNNTNDNINNGGASVGYTNLQNPIGIDLGLGYLYNLADAGIFNSDMYVPSGEFGLPINGYVSHVGAWAMNAEIMPGPFTLGVNYVTAIAAFNTTNLIQKTNTYIDDTPDRTASPSAGDVYGSYQFNTYGYASKLSATYQWSEQAYFSYFSNNNSFDGISKQRQSLEYDVNILSNTVLSFEYRHDLSYGVENNGCDWGNNTETMQISVLL